MCPYAAISVYEAKNMQLKNDFYITDIESDRMETSEKVPTVEHGYWLHKAKKIKKRVSGQLKWIAAVA